MKANELMVGDFVMMGKKTYRCANICGHTNDILLDNGVITNVGNLSPIPLTPEILEKNGFTKGGMFGKTYYLAVEDFEISVYFAHVNTQLIIEKRNGSEIINILNVEYLHILQHALKLCGIEKTIEL